jgi:hypothetical protein
VKVKKVGGGGVKSPEKYLEKLLENILKPNYSCLALAAIFFFLENIFETQLLMPCPGRDFLGNRGREGELPIRAAHPSHSREAGVKIIDFHPSFPPVCSFGGRG